MNLYEEQFCIQEYDFSINSGSRGFVDIETPAGASTLEWGIVKSDNQTNWVLWMDFPDLWQISRISEHFGLHKIFTDSGLNRIRYLINFNRSQDFAWTREMIGMLTEEFLDNTDPGVFITHTAVIKFLCEIVSCIGRAFGYHIKKINMPKPEAFAAFGFQFFFKDS